MKLSGFLEEMKKGLLTKIDRNSNSDKRSLMFVVKIQSEGLKLFVRCASKLKVLALPKNFKK